MRVSAILPAAGSGTRLKTKVPKSFFKICGKPLIIHTLLALKKAHSFNEVIIATSRESIKPMQILLEKYKILDVRVVEGGATRAESVAKALKVVSRNSKYVLVHDAARPLVTKKIIFDLLREVQKSKAAICAVPVTSTVKRVDISKKEIMKTEKREELFLAQTPQVFERELLVSQYQKLGGKAFLATDEANLFDDSWVKVKLVAGDVRNIKVTIPEDLKLFEYYYKGLKR